eukprot:gene11361-4529_t
MEEAQLSLLSKQASEMTYEQVEKILDTSTQNGLTMKEVNRRRDIVGLNELEEEEEESLVMKYLGQFQEPLVLLLLASAFISILIKQYDDAISITLAIVIVCTVAFVQEYRSEQTLDALKKIVTHKCHVVREGIVEVIHASELVPGDVVVFSVGDRIPADIRLTKAVELTIAEAELTGESSPVQKQIEPIDFIPNQEEDDIKGRISVAYMASLVTAGNGRGIVFATGVKTQIGTVSKLLGETEDKKTPLQKSMDDLGKQLSIFSIAVIAVIFVIGVFNGRSWFEMFVIGVAMAVAAIPEGLPIVTTVTLAMGVMRMASRKAIVKKLPSVETLGCTTIICCDKTGTLTQNQMTVKKIFTLHDENVINVEGSSDFQGTFERNQKRISVKDENDVVKLLEISVLCNNAHLENHNVIGEPTEVALIHTNIKAGLPDHRNEWKRIHEIPFSSTTKWMSVECQNIETNEKYFFVKGAIESILPKCTTFYHNDKLKKFTSTEADIVEKESNKVASKAMRVLGFAYGKELDDLTFCGFVGMIDPPRAGIKENIKTLSESGVRTIMITGDSKLTAMSIAEDLGILTNEYPMAMSPNEIQQDGFLSKIGQTNVFYRMSPKHKMHIVDALQKTGNVVAMTGDGVNDAVAVKLADIGIAMGSGTDVCKEASKMVLLDDNFSTIMAAIEEGKTIFNGIKNFLRFQLSTSISALALIAITNVLGYAPPLNPMQILWINVIMDGPPAQTLGVEPATKETMNQPPRNANDSVITRKLLISVFLNSIIMISGSLYIFLTEAKGFEMTTRETTMTFCVFVFYQMFNALNCRSENKSIFQIGFFTNTAFLFAVGGCIIGQLCLIYLPFMRYIFETEYLTLFDLLLTIGVGSTVFIFEEILKLLKSYK